MSTTRKAVITLVELHMQRAWSVGSDPFQAARNALPNVPETVLRDALARLEDAKEMRWSADLEIALQNEASLHSTFEALRSFKPRIG